MSSGPSLRKPVRGRRSPPPAPTAPPRNDEDRPLISAMGTRHHSRILKTWSPAALAALGIRWAATGKPASASDVEAGQ
jgi:hypothetical protein